MDAYELTGPLLLLAGPGTGKTTTLARRIKHLVQVAGVSPEAITVMTFTSAAAAEMRSRISDPSEKRKAEFVEPQLRPKNIRTMHSFGDEIVRSASTDFGLPERPRVVSELSTRNLLLEDASQLAGNLRSEAAPTGDCRQRGACLPSDGPKCATCGQYREILKACGAIDHDDQILLACQALKSRADLLDRCRDQTQHLLVDEYQDVNRAQFELISLLSASNRGGLFVVGDDDQSIYGWRGGSPEYIRRFEADFGPDARVESLSHCFRCNESILEGALAVVKQFDKSRRDKGNLTYGRDTGQKILVHEVPSNTWEEIEAVRLIDESGSRSVLILVPNRPFAAGLMSRLHRKGIPFLGPPPTPGEGLWLFDRLAAWTEDPSDSLALRELLQSMLNNPLFGVPSAKVRRDDKRARRDAAFSLVAGLWEGVIDGKYESLWAALKASSEQDSLLQHLHQSSQDLLDVPAREVPELLRRGAEFMLPWQSKEAFFKEVAQWMASTDRGQKGTGQVRVMTFQSAKGLEASVVAVLGLEEGILPRTTSDEGLAEQSRLMYVAMTRTADELHLLYTRKRPGSISYLSPGKRSGYKPPEKSRFLDAIPAGFIESSRVWR